MTSRGALEVLVIVAGIGGATWGARDAWERWGPRGERFEADPRVQRSVTPDGRQVEIVDSDGDLVVDTWSYFDAGRLAEMVFDDDQDGRPDRRRTFGADGSAIRTESLAGQNGR